MSQENRDLCNNPFVALFGSISQVELYKTSVGDAAKSGMYTRNILISDLTSNNLFIVILLISLMLSNKLAQTFNRLSKIVRVYYFLHIICF